MRLKLFTSIVLVLMLLSCRDSSKSEMNTRENILKKLNALENGGKYEELKVNLEEVNTSLKLINDSLYQLDVYKNYLKAAKEIRVLREKFSAQYDPAVKEQILAIEKLNGASSEGEKKERLLEYNVAMNRLKEVHDKIGYTELSKNKYAPARKALFDNFGKVQPRTDLIERRNFLLSQLKEYNNTILKYKLGLDTLNFLDEEPLTH